MTSVKLTSADGKFLVDVDITLKAVTLVVVDPPPIVIPPSSSQFYKVGDLTLKWPKEDLGCAPEPYSVPAALRTIRVTNDIQLQTAAKDLRAGDRIVIAAGNYKNLVLSGNGSEIGTALNRIVIVGEPGVTIHGLSVLFNLSYVSLINLILPGGNGVGDYNSTYGVALNFGVHDIDVVGCVITPTGKWMDGINISNSPAGGNRFLNNWIEWQGTMTPGPDTRAGYVSLENRASIHFTDGMPIGNNNVIAGNWFTRFHDGLMCGTVAFQENKDKPSHNLVVRNNKSWHHEDDGLELDGWHVGLICEGNVIGGSKEGLTAGISIAPGGPGPILVRNNHISGFANLPFKFNTEVMDAETDDCEVTGNTVVQVSEEAENYGIGWYFAQPVNLLKNLRIHHNTMLFRGAPYVTENFVIPGLVLDYNKIWSTREFDYAQGSLFRFHDHTLGSNVYMKSIEELRTKFGHEMHGAYAQLTATPVPVSPDIPVTELCRWKVV